MGVHYLQYVMLLMEKIRWQGIFGGKQISPDGKRCRTVLGKSDGIDTPYAIYFDKVKNNLVVCNHNGTVFLYKVE
jgi:hypothetical protein